jgi:hypothetical protein
MALSKSKKIIVIILGTAVVGAFLFMFFFVYPYNCAYAQEYDAELTLDQALNAAQHSDFDRDCIPNADDNCPAIFNPLQVDLDKNGIGNACQS